MAITEHWNIRSRSHTCAATGRPFAVGEAFFTALYDTADGLERRDYSTDAWADLPPDADQPFSSWKSVYTPPERAAKPEAVAGESEDDLLRRLVAEDDPATENARFILAVMLERRKLLRQTDSQTIGEMRLLIYEHRKTGEVLVVRDPGVPLSKVEAIQQEVLELLGRQTPGDTAESGPGSPALAEALPAPVPSDPTAAS